ncbi:hypothetical protein AALO_G00252420 [Alosa alosa]|uniref:Uncharacterized protein n=1 Tax=Alosa alosa TaxID=278164 RepID=A0AAV6FN55_9TELE|nr:hypothetical protein AALO_G00252420 [Alosa alosa]
MGRVQGDTELSNSCRGEVQIMPRCPPSQACGQECGTLRYSSTCPPTCPQACHQAYQSAGLPSLLCNNQTLSQSLNHNLAPPGSPLPRPRLPCRPQPPLTPAFLGRVRSHEHRHPNAHAPRGTPPARPGPRRRTARVS